MDKKRRVRHYLAVLHLKNTMIDTQDDYWMNPVIISDDGDTVAVYSGEPEISEQYLKLIGREELVTLFKSMSVEEMDENICFYTEHKPHLLAGKTFYLPDMTEPLIDDEYHQRTEQVKAVREYLKDDEKVFREWLKLYKL